MKIRQFDRAHSPYVIALGSQLRQLALAYPIAGARDRLKRVATRLISAVGATGGFFGPGLVGLVKRGTAGDSGAFLMLAGIGTVGCLICIGLRQTAHFKWRTGEHERAERGETPRDLLRWS